MTRCSDTGKTTTAARLIDGEIANGRGCVILLDGPPKFDSKQKQQIVLAVLHAELSAAEAARRHGSSERSVAEGRLPSEIEGLVRRRRFPADGLRLEVSEDVVMVDPERTLDVLAALREIGVRTALDDFRGRPRVAGPPQAAASR